MLLSTSYVINQIKPLTSLILRCFLSKLNKTARLILLFGFNLTALR